MNESPESIRRRNELKKFLKKRINPKSFSHYILKLCKDCNRVKSCKWNSSFTTKGVPEYVARCGDCQSKYLKGVRRKARSRLTYQKRIRSRKNKKKCVDYLGGKCIKCGYNKSLYALTFNHRDPSKKIGIISVMLQDLAFSNNKLIDELNKCDLLCFNCHMEIHGEERDAK